MTTASEPVGAPSGAVDLYWIPLGAGARVVRVSGLVFEAVSARWHRRPRGPLYHSALVVHIRDGRYVIEQAPVPDAHGERRGVVASGPVGARWAGRFRIFRYEVRRWNGGQIPDLAQAVGGPVRLFEDLAWARRVLDVLPDIPTPVWGRDELGTGEMWNSNAVIAWTLERAGANPVSLRPPGLGRAPGWNAGVTVARRSTGSTRPG